MQHRPDWPGSSPTRTTARPVARGPVARQRQETASFGSVRADGGKSLAVNDWSLAVTKSTAKLNRFGRIGCLVMEDTNDLPPSFVKSRVSRKSGIILRNRAGKSARSARFERSSRSPGANVILARLMTLKGEQPAHDRLHNELPFTRTPEGKPEFKKGINNFNSSTVASTFVNPLDTAQGYAKHFYCIIYIRQLADLIQPKQIIPDQGYQPLAGEDFEQHRRAVFRPFEG